MLNSTYSSARQHLHFGTLAATALSRGGRPGPKVRENAAFGSPVHHFTTLVALAPTSLSRGGRPAPKVRGSHAKMHQKPAFRTQRYTSFPTQVMEIGTKSRTFTHFGSGAATVRESCGRPGSKGRGLAAFWLPCSPLYRLW